MASQLTKLAANFSTTLTTNVSVGGLTATMASNLTKEGVALPDGKWCFTLNQGNSNEQHFLCDLAGTAISNVQGVDHLGNVNTGFLKDARVNNEIKVTDYVDLLRIIEILSGSKPLDGGTPIKYDAAPSLSNDRQIPDKGYVDAGLATKAGLADDNVMTGNNTFSGGNTFNTSPTVPNPVGANDAVNLATLNATALGSVTVFQGFQNAQLEYDNQGRIESVYDAYLQETFFLTYASELDYVPNMVSTDNNYWLIEYDETGAILSTKKY